MGRRRLRWHLRPAGPDGAGLSSATDAGGDLGRGGQGGRWTAPRSALGTRRPFLRSHSEL